MAWPTGQQVPTDNLDSSTGNPSLARIDLYNAVLYLNAIIAAANEEYGPVVTNGFNKINTAQLPNVIAVEGDASLEPTTKIVTVKDTLRLNQRTTEQILAVTGSEIGDVMMCNDAVDGAGTGPAICFWDGTEWKFMLLSGLTTLE